MSPLLNAATALSESPEGGRQFNVWRNLARLFARTEFVMMLDVAFAVCTNWRMDIRSAVQRAGQSTAKSDGSSEGLPMDIVKKLCDGTAAPVIPTFEYARQDDGIDQRTFRRTRPYVAFTLVHTLVTDICSTESCTACDGSSTEASNVPRFLGSRTQQYRLSQVSIYATGVTRSLQGYDIPECIRAICDHEQACVMVRSPSLTLHVVMRVCILKCQV